MGAPLLGKHFAELQSASAPAVAVAAAGSFAGQVVAVVQAAPLWLYVLAAVAPWVPILVLELVWTARHYKWLAVFCLLVITQSAYLLERVAQVLQLHLHGRDAVDAPGIFGALDGQRVHLLWATWAVIGLLLLLKRFPRNPWLWLTLVIAASDVVGQAQLGSNAAQPEFSLLLSVADIAALNLAFAFQLGRTYDAALARAFPHLPERLLIQATAALEEIRLRPGEQVKHDVARVYIVAHGTGRLVRDGPGGHEILVRLLSPGQVVTDEGTLLAAETALELLALPAGAV